MEQVKDVFALIRENYKQMSKSHKKMADFILGHYERAVFMTASKIGEELGISESTVVRFPNVLGIDGYPEFQQTLAEFLQSRLSRMEKLDAKFGHSAQSEVIREVLKSDMDKIQDTMDYLDADAFAVAVDAILNARHVYIMGLRSNEPLASFLHFYVNMMRGDVTLLGTNSMTETFEQMIRISDKDCFIGISFPRYSMRTLKAMEFASSRNAKVIALTDNDHSPVCMYSTCNLLAKSDMVSIVDSLVAPLSVINALIVSMVLKKPEQVKKNLDLLAETWNNYQVYMNDEIDFVNGDAILDYSLRKDEN